MADTYLEKSVAAESDPVIGAIAYASGDATYLVHVRGIYVGNAGATGSLQCVMANGTTVTFTGLLVGQIYPFKITSIVGAGTTISGHILV